MAHNESLVQRAEALFKAACRLEIPRLISEHCADRIGETLGSLLVAAGKATVFKKVHFDLSRQSGVISQIRSFERPQIIVFGIEAHVCVLQSAIGLHQAGFDVSLVTDAISSRHEHDSTIAIDRARDLNIRCVTTEMVLFEWMERGDSEAFREFLPIIRSLPGAGA